MAVTHRNSSLTNWSSYHHCFFCFCIVPGGPPVPRTRPVHDVARRDQGGNSQRTSNIPSLDLDYSNSAEMAPIKLNKFKSNGHIGSQRIRFLAEWTQGTRLGLLTARCTFPSADRTQTKPPHLDQISMRNHCRLF